MKVFILGRDQDKMASDTGTLREIQGTWRYHLSLDHKHNANLDSTDHDSDVHGHSKLSLELNTRNITFATS